MGDEEAAPLPTYAYTGERAEGVEHSITAGEEPKVLTKTVTLLGAREGVGEAAYPNGDTYKGEFKDGKRDGEGTYTYAAQPPAGEGEDPKPPACVYEGRWKAGVKSGTGVQTYANGDKYHGTFAKSTMNGQGAFFYASGDIYTGEWVDGKKNGQGTYLYKESGAKAAGTWVDGVLVEGTFTDKFGNEYAGRFAGDAAAPGSYVAGGDFKLASGAFFTVPKPTKAELLAELAAFDADGNGYIDAAELKAILTRPGTGSVAMDEGTAGVFLEILTDLFDANSDGRLSVAECATAISNQYLVGFA